MEDRKMSTASIYLVGYISNGKKNNKHGIIEKCQEWRNWFKIMRPGYRWIDPMEGETLDAIKDSGLSSDYPCGSLVARDYNSVKNADIILVNTDTFGQDRPLIGSIFEMAWAYEFHKPIIMISSDEYYVKHPFIKSICSCIVDTREEALRNMDYIVKGL